MKQDWLMERVQIVSSQAAAVAVTEWLIAQLA